MGKGDKKTQRGKLFSGSYGVLRPRKRKSGFSVINTTKKAAVEQEKTKVSKPKPETKPVVETVVEEKVKPAEAKAVAAKEKQEVVAEKPKKAATKQAKPEAKKSAAKKPATKEEKPEAKKPAAKKEPKPKEEAPKEDTPKDKK